MIEEDLDPLVVHHFRAVNPGFEHHTLGIYEQVTFPAFDLLAAVVTELFSSHAGALDRLLAVHHASAGLGVALLAYPHTLLVQGGVHPFPGALTRRQVLK